MNRDDLLFIGALLLGAAFGWVACEEYAQAKVPRAELPPPRGFDAHAWELEHLHREVAALKAERPARVRVQAFPKKGRA